VAIGVSVLIISLVTKGKIGSGDGVVLMITGMCLGFFDNLFLLLTAAFLSAIVGIFLLLIKKVNRNYEIPFIPFLFVSFVGGLFL
jgi:leader peptidase (prepilin peptidase)/N-methyltransferase